MKMKRYVDCECEIEKWVGTKFYLKKKIFASTMIIQIAPKTQAN